MAGRTTRTSQKAGISKTLISFAQKPRAKSPTPPERQTDSPQSDFLFPQPDNPPDNPDEPHTPDEDEPQDPFHPQEDDPEPPAPGERDLAQALELLANKIAGMPSASSKPKNQVKPRVPDTFDGSDDVQHTRLTSENEYFTRLEHIYLTSTIRSLVAPHFDHRTTRDPPHLPQRVYRSVQNVAALSTAPGQVYTSYRAVPTSQIAQNIENIDRRNIAPST